MRVSPALRWTSALALGLVLSLTAHGAEAKEKNRKDGDAAAGTPYPSTYKPYPGRPTALVGATVYDGRGGRIDNGTVLFEGGKLVGVGGADLPVPEGYDRIARRDRHPFAPRRLSLAFRRRP